MNNNRQSIPTIDNPEFINLQPLDINPLMSKCDIKVLYVGQNRNRSYITKEVATEMSKTLRGCPIVGYFVEAKEDYSDHGEQVIIDGEGIKVNNLTKPYGFVAPDAKVWFQFFEDTDEFGNNTIREYLMTEGYLWTGQYEEAKRVIDQGNPQSMELDEKTLKGYWSTDNNKGIDFFIINDAIFSKLCILGEDVEPCFEGSSITAPDISSKFSKDNEFMNELLTMMNELKYTLNNNKGGKKMHKDGEETSFENQKSVEAPISNFEDAGLGAEGGDAGDDGEQSVAEETPIEASAEETPAVPAAQSAENEDVSDVTLNAADQATIAAMGEDYAPAGETNTEALIKDGATNVPKSILQNAKSCDKEEKNDKEQDKKDKSNNDNSDNNNEEDTKDKEDNKKKYSLEEIEVLEKRCATLEEENAKLLAFKLDVENKEKDALINSFYMLSDEDKKDVIENKTNYSLDDIEAKLSVICVRKKVNFNIGTKENTEASIYNLNSHEVNSSSLPTWLSAVESYRNSKNNN